MSTILFFCELHFNPQFCSPELETAHVDIPRNVKDYVTSEKMVMSLEISKISTFKGLQTQKFDENGK
jgi:hypothetical protein